VDDSLYRSEVDRQIIKNHYRQTWTTLLSEGFAHSLNLDDCRPTFEELRKVMPKEAVSNLVNLKVCTSSLLPLDALLTSNRLSSLETLDVMVASTPGFTNLVPILHRHAAHLPRLDTIAIHCLSAEYVYLWLEVDIKQMLADMGFFLSHSKTCLVRFVQNPPPVLPPPQRVQ
jgi:hypothetical protein